MKISYSQPLINQYKPSLTPSFGNEAKYSYYKGAVKDINKVFDKPVEKRSTHLVHEKHPVTGQPISGRFSLTAKDGAKITVSKAISGSINSTFRYVVVEIKKDDRTQIIRMDMDSGRPIKTGHKDPKGSKKNKVEYYNEIELERLGTKTVLEQYLPDITKIVKSRGTKEMQIADVKPLPDKKLRPRGYLGVDLVQKPTRKRVSSKDLILENMSIRHNVGSKNDNSKTQELTQYHNSINATISVFEKYHEFWDNMSHCVQVRFLAKNPSIDKVSRTTRAVIFKPDENGERFKITYIPKNNMLRIIVSDEKNETKRGYLIYNGNKLVKNFILDRPNVYSNTKKYYNEQEFKEFEKTFDSDIKIVEQKMEQLNNSVNKFIQENKKD